MESELGRIKLERGVQLVVGMRSLCMDEGLESVDEVDGVDGPEGQVWHIWEGEGRGLDRQP